MAVKHGVIDSDKHFLIDPITRTIKNQSGKLVLIQYDHNSERFTFQCPRLVDGHDMSLCNSVRIHFINVGAGNAKTNGIYEVDDLQVSGVNNNVVTFSWLISQNATRYAGKLNFIIRFACLDEEAVIEYAWNTGVYSDITIAQSIYNGEEFVEDYIDVLEMWKQDLYSEGVKIVSVEQTVTSTDDGGVNIVKMEMTDGTIREFEFRNGSKGTTGTFIEFVEQITTSDEDGGTNVIRMKMSDGTVKDFEFKNGTKGTDAISIESIEQTSGDGSAGSTDTYTITMTDNSTKTFQIHNGTDGVLGVSSNGIQLLDDITGGVYKLYVQNGELMMASIDGESGASGGMQFIDSVEGGTYTVYVENGKLKMDKVTETATPSDDKKELATKEYVDITIQTLINEIADGFTDL